jgi:hypothetical protein
MCVSLLFTSTLYDQHKVAVVSRSVRSVVFVYCKELCEESNDDIWNSVRFFSLLS